MSEDLTKNLPSSQDEKLTQVWITVQSLDRRVGDIEIRLGSIETKVVSMDTRLESLEGSVAERLFDTRPIWEKVVADIGLLQGGQERLQEGLDSLRTETRTGFRDLKRQFSVLNDTFLEVRADYKDLDRRVYHLEEPRS